MANPRATRVYAAPMLFALGMTLVACDRDAGPAMGPGAAPQAPAEATADDSGAARPDAAPVVDGAGPAGEPGGHAARWDGFGPATFGMTADAIRAAWAGDLGGNPAEEAGCYHLSPTSQPDYAYFAMMFGEGRLVRYSVSNDAMVAPGGGRRGMSDDDIEALYAGRVERGPHKYTDGEYLRIAGEGDRVLVFETDDTGTVTEWRVGIPPYVDYVEGCS